MCIGHLLCWARCLGSHSSSRRPRDLALSAPAKRDRLTLRQETVWLVQDTDQGRLTLCPSLHWEGSPEEREVEESPEFDECRTQSSKVQKMQVGDKQCPSLHLWGLCLLQEFSSKKNRQGWDVRWFEGRLTTARWYSRGSPGSQPLILAEVCLAPFTVWWQPWQLSRMVLLQVGTQRPVLQPPRSAVLETQPPAAWTGDHAWRRLTCS